MARIHRCVCSQPAMPRYRFRRLQTGSTSIAKRRQGAPQTQGDAAAIAEAERPLRQGGRRNSRVARTLATLGAARRPDFEQPRLRQIKAGRRYCARLIVPSGSLFRIEQFRLRGPDSRSKMTLRRSVILLRATPGLAVFQANRSTTNVASASPHFFPLLSILVTASALSSLVIVLVPAASLTAKLTRSPACTAFSRAAS
jgi:hypothetical protein